MLGTMIDIIMYGPGAGSLNTLEGCWHAYSPPSVPFPGSFLLGTVRVPTDNPGPYD